MTEISQGMVWLTIEAAAHRIGCTPRTIRRWAQDDLITIRLGRIDEHELLLAQRTVRATRRAIAIRNLQVNAKTSTMTPTDDPCPHGTIAP